ncbi:radical SAM protein [Dactylosporangium sp. NPDC050688]|uniref:radical SAM protein n=1 Tax=Dactylosporangium sp. NPDC050688 TaxID=3157217 RepID=UPI003411D5AA
MRTGAITVDASHSRSTAEGGQAMYEAIVSPQEDLFVAVRPGHSKGMSLPAAYYAELLDRNEAGLPVPDWFVDGARRQWTIDLAGQRVDTALAVRSPSTAAVTYSRATYEINKGCNFSCEHCYLELRPFEGLALPDKLRLIDMLAEVGVFWFQITGGEPLIDPDFPAVYERAHQAGMMIEILTNGSRLSRPHLVSLFQNRPPHRIVVSLYGASPATADRLTRTKGAFTNMHAGVRAATAAGLPVQLTIIITRHNVDEVDAMRALAGSLNVPTKEYGMLSPTYTGAPGPLDAQAPGFLDASFLESAAPGALGDAGAFDSCPAGHTFFHVDPHGLATMCKIGRDNPVHLMAEGIDGLLRLPAIADAQMLRTGGCTGCSLTSTCRVCRPLARIYQEAKAPLHSYCQHGERTPA